jgi:hypothetical protein
MGPDIDVTNDDRDMRRHEGGRPNNVAVDVCVKRLISRPSIGAVPEFLVYPAGGGCRSLPGLPNCLIADQLYFFQSAANRTRMNQRSTDRSTQSIRKDVGAAGESWRNVILQYLDHKT